MSLWAFRLFMSASSFVSARAPVVPRWCSASPWAIPSSSCGQSVRVSARRRRRLRSARGATAASRTPSTCEDGRRRARLVLRLTALVNLAPRSASRSRRGYRHGRGRALVFRAMRRLVADVSGYVFVWSSGTAACVGPRRRESCARRPWLRRRTDVDALYADGPGGVYWYERGINPAEVWAFVAGVVPCVPGFLRAAGRRRPSRAPARRDFRRRVVLRMLFPGARAPRALRGTRREKEKDVEKRRRRGGEEASNSFAYARAWGVGFVVVVSNRVYQYKRGSRCSSPERSSPERSSGVESTPSNSPPSRRVVSLTRCRRPGRICPPRRSLRSGNLPGHLRVRHERDSQSYPPARRPGRSASNA